MPGPMIGHLYKGEVAVTRKDGAVMGFRTYQLGPHEWGYELCRANGKPVVSTISDPDWASEQDVIEAIHRHAPLFEHHDDLGWYVANVPSMAPR